MNGKTKPSSMGMVYFISGPNGTMDLTELELRVLLSAASKELEVRKQRTGSTEIELKVKERIESFRKLHKDRVV